MSEEVLIINGLLAVLCYAMAGSRNRNELGWGILGFLFGIFAVVVLALLGKVDSN